MLALTIYLVRRFVLQPLGLVTKEPDEKGAQRRWLESIGYYTKKK